MHFLSSQLYHVYNQGNNRETIFYHREDYLHFLKLVKKYVQPHCQILAWCLMPNHFHFSIATNANSVQTIKIGGNQLTLLNNGFRLLQTNYAQHINAQNGRTGSLFRQKAKSKCLTDEAISKGDDELFSNDVFNGYPWVCLHYIHQNPVKANLVSHPSNWEFSSFQDYAGLRSGTLCDIELGRRLIGLSDVDFDLSNVPELPEGRVKKLFV